MVAQDRNSLPVSFGFTVVELLVVIAIIGALSALLLPAVQSSREAARQTQCINNLKQIGLGILNHEQVLMHFPFGGWGHEWVGVPGRGAEEKQPGGWIYNSLPYLERGDSCALGAAIDSEDSESAYSRRLSTPINILTCPSRRSCSVWNVADSPAYLSHPKPSGHVSRVARADYAINAGTAGVASWPGPESLEEGDSPTYSWPKPKDFNGISHLHVGISRNRILDGLTYTYLVGEKFINPEHYADGLSRGDNETLYSGYATDLHRWAREDLLLAQDTDEIPDSSGQIRFGSAHPTVCHFVFCDGSVRAIPHTLSSGMHMAFANRQDEVPPVDH